MKNVYSASTLRQYYDVFRSHPALTVTIVATVTFAIMLVYIYLQGIRLTFSSSRKITTSVYSGRDREVQIKAREAAEQRNEEWKSKQILKKRKVINKPINTKTTRKINEGQLTNNTTSIRRSNRVDGRNHHIQSASSLSLSTIVKMDEMFAASMPVYNDGLIMFRHLFQMKNANHAASILQRLASEFVSIIRQRQYNVISVSEFCCCGDGMDYQMGGQSLSVKAGEKINHVESERVMGYNRVVLPNGKYRNTSTMTIGIDVNQYTSSIHLRLRTPSNHEAQFLSYELICEHFCHELAHCVYHDHSPEFYALMADIQKQHREKVHLVNLKKELM